MAKKEQTVFYYGQYEARLDQHNQFCLPARFREILAAGANNENRLIFTYVDYLRIYSIDAFNQQIEMIKNQFKEEESMNKIAIIRRMLADSMETKWNWFGKVEIPLAMLKKTGFQAGDKLTVLGNEKWIEVWKHGDWEAEMKKFEISNEIDVRLFDDE